jgi:FkbM family methyltransferase
VVFDLGAHLEYFSILILANNPEVDLHIFEPDKSNFELLQENLKLNGFNGANIHLNNLAISNQDGFIQFYSYSASQNNSKFKLPGVSYETNEIKQQSFLNYLAINKIKNIEILKVDIEGMEHELFASIETNIGKSFQIQKIFLELHKIPSNLGYKALNPKLFAENFGYKLKVDGIMYTMERLK